MTAPEEEKFDVWVRSVPAKTPQGDEFVEALARIFAVELWMAEHIANQAPTIVKRNVGRTIADSMRDVLELLGAGVEIRSARPQSAHPPPAWPPGLPSDSPHGSLPASRSYPPDRFLPSPPPRPSARFSQPPASPSLRPTAPPTARSWTPLPPPRQGRTLTLSTGTVLFAGAAAIALLFVWLTHWLRATAEVRSLGNTPTEQSACGSHYGLTGPGIDPEMRAKLTLVVAWRTGCLSDDYRKFLQDLGEAHRGELVVIGAGLAPPGLPPPGTETSQSTTSPWPPTACEPGFEMLPISRGYVSDSLSAPATYLYDADGGLIAAWRGGMAPMQRKRLADWLDEKE
jgi:hypothetical protein